MNKRLPGQTLVIVLLAMVASLTVGLAVSTRTISTLRQTTFTSQSAGALAAAESGAEEALKRLNDPSDSCSTNVINGSSSCSYNSVSKTYTSGPCLTDDDGSGYYRKVFSGTSESGASFSYCVEKGGGSNTYSFDLEKDKTQEIKINKEETGSYEGSTIGICWYIKGFDKAPAASLEIIGVSGAALLFKYAYNSNQDGMTGNGFDIGLTGDGTYSNCITGIDVTNAKIVRIRAIYNDVSVGVKSEGGNPLPFQSYQINSVGSLGGVVKKVRVTKSLPALPSIFDFGLFSGSETEPLKNQ